MRTTRDDKRGKRPFSDKAVLSAVRNLDETRGRLNLAGLALAEPLLSVRAGHAAREAARAAADPRATKEEIAERVATRDRVAGDLALLRRETERAQVTPATPSDSRHAVLYGRVVEGGKPVARARVVAEAPGVRLEHACADKEGRYALDVPGDVEVTFAVARATGPIVHRDKSPTTLSAGQRRYREFDLGAGEPPCEAPRDDDTPPKGTTPRDTPPKETAPPKPPRDQQTPPKETPPRTAWYEPGKAAATPAAKAEAAKAATTAAKPATTKKVEPPPKAASTPTAKPTRSTPPAKKG